MPKQTVRHIIKSLHIGKWMPFQVLQRWQKGDRFEGGGVWRGGPLHPLSKKFLKNEVENVSFGGI